MKIIVKVPNTLQVQVLEVIKKTVSFYICTDSAGNTRHITPRRVLIWNASENTCQTIIEHNARLFQERLEFNNKQQRQIRTLWENLVPLSNKEPKSAY